MRRCLLVGLVLTGLLVLLSVLVGTHLRPLMSVDHAVGRAAFDATARHSERVAFWTFVTTWGQPNALRLLMVLGAVFVAVRGRRDLGLWLVVLVVVEAVAAPLAKHVLHRPRPVWTHPITTVGSTSFPSGHATAAAAAATAFLLVCRAVGGTAVTRLAAPALAFALAGAVAASRVLLGVHFLSDVVGGLLLGGALAASTFAAATRRSPAGRQHGP